MQVKTLANAVSEANHCVARDDSFMTEKIDRFVLPHQCSKVVSFSCVVLDTQEELMALKKSELYSSLWKSCDELRGGMDASQYKDYVLILLFVKYVSDKYAGDADALIDVPAGGSFADMVAAKGSKEIGDRINKIIGRLADANDSLKGAINIADFNDEEKLGKADAMVQRLTKLVAIFEGLDFGGNRAEGDDLLGDAYEYLMRHFATESGKSKGQFYIPAEVSRVMSMVPSRAGYGSISNWRRSPYSVWNTSWCVNWRTFWNDISTNASPCSSRSMFHCGGDLGRS